MSWGVKIACLYTGFAALIATMVSLTMRENIDLVTPDYYEQELNYQGRIDAIDRTLQLNEPLTWEVKENRLYLYIPKELEGKEVSGTICFFRPSDARLDEDLTFPATRNGSADVSLRLLRKGLYKMQITWQADSVSYYNEGVIQIN